MPPILRYRHPSGVCYRHPSGVWGPPPGAIYYAVGRQNATPLEFWQFDASGNLLDSFDSASAVAIVSVAVDRDGNIYYAYDQTIRKLSPAYALLWSYSPAKSITGISVDADRNVYFRTNNHTPTTNFYKLDSDGNHVWDIVALDNAGWSCVGPSGDIYATSSVRTAVGLKNIGRYTPAGVEVWAQDFGASAFILRDFDIDADENLIVTGQQIGGKSVWKFDQNGTQLWSYNTGGQTIGAGFDALGNAVIGGVRASSKTVWKLDPSGALIWSFDTGQTQAGNVSVASSGISYIGGTRNAAVPASLWVLTASGTSIRTFDSGQEILHTANSKSLRTLRT